MSVFSIDRRSVVKSGLAAGGLALVAAPAWAMQFAPGPKPVPASGAVGLWTIFSGRDGAVFRLAQLDAHMRPRGIIAIARLGAERVGSMAQLQAASRGFAIAAVAQSWGVPAVRCRMEADVITGPDSGHSVHCLRWIDFL